MIENKDYNVEKKKVKNNNNSKRKKINERKIMKTIMKRKEKKIC